MIFCTKCGTELPDDANFCLSCGKPQGDDTAAQPTAAADTSDAETRWETCRISWMKSGFGLHQFVAVVHTSSGEQRILDPRRRNITTDSNHGPVRKASDTNASYSALVQRLIREGWEPAGSDSNWWEERFRRPDAKRSFERCEIVLRGKRFVADAIGPAGQYDAATTDKLKGLTEKSQLDGGRASHEGLVVELEQDGWQRLDESGSRWWELHFRRPLTHD